MKFNNRACFIACLFFSISGFSKVIKDDHYTTGYESYPWKEVCLKLTQKNYPLIEAAGINQLDCMGKKVMVSKFCEISQASNPYYSRASVDVPSKTVRCYSAKKVHLKWECEGKSDPYCKDKEIGCFLFKEKLASRLKLVHSSLIEEKFLNCYFDTQENDLSL